MRNRIIATLEVDENCRLICACFNTHLLYSVRLLILRANEVRLNDGRFQSFSRHQQANTVVIPAKKLGIPWQTTDEVIEWISDHQFNTWSIRGVPIDVSNFALEFSFEAPAEASLFALRWR